MKNNTILKIALLIVSLAGGLLLTPAANALPTSRATNAGANYQKAAESNKNKATASIIISLIRNNPKSAKEIAMYTMIGDQKNAEKHAETALRALLTSKPAPKAQAVAALMTKTIEVMSYIATNRESNNTTTTTLEEKQKASLKIIKAFNKKLLDVLKKSVSKNQKNFDIMNKVFTAFSKATQEKIEKSILGAQNNFLDGYLQKLVCAGGGGLDGSCSLAPKIGKKPQENLTDNETKAAAAGTVAAAQAGATAQTIQDAIIAAAGENSSQLMTIIQTTLGTSASPN